MHNSKAHLSVMLNEVLNILSPHDNVTYIDATFGAGGHTRAILQYASNCKVIGIDRDPNVCRFASECTDEYNDRFQFINAKFSEIAQLGISNDIAGILFDIGMSSMQINNATRGFSFMRDGPLSMQMGHNTLSAYDVVNHYNEVKIAEILYKYGDEKAAGKIAQAICRYRKNSTIDTTLQLSEIVKSVVHHRGKIHPATLTFQAIRVFINDELQELESGLKAAFNLLGVNGKIVVITFQGHEDKIVKNIFQQHTQKSHQNKFKIPQIVDKKIFKLITKNVIKPSKIEINKNNRARSAKIRSVMRVC